MAEMMMMKQQQTHILTTAVWNYYFSSYFPAIFGIFKLGVNKYLFFHFLSSELIFLVIILLNIIVLPCAAFLVCLANQKPLKYIGCSVNLIF